MNEKRKQEYKMIGLNIAYYRKLRGLTQLQLAESVNISRTHIVIQRFVCCHLIMFSNKLK